MITPVRQAANNRRTLAALRAKLTAMSVEWDEVDEFFRSEFESLATKVEDLENHLAEFVKEGGKV